jgi:hypothetical protein
MFFLSDLDVEGMVGLSSNFIISAGTDEEVRDKQFTTAIVSHHSSLMVSTGILAKMSIFDSLI